MAGEGAGAIRVGAGVQRTIGTDNVVPDTRPIDHGDGEFSLVSHLKYGSVRVQKDDRVRASDIVAEVGNSGASLHPHVHYELRTGWGVHGIRGLPAYFHDLTVIGTGEGGLGRPVVVSTGDIVLAR